MPGPIKRPDGSRPVVSIVEDDGAMLAALADLLDAAGYETQAFESGEAFMMSPAGLASDVVITDVQMGEMDGLSLMAKLREVSRKHLPVIVITAITDENLRRSALEQGCHAFLRKPFDPNALVEQVVSAMGEPRHP